MYRALSTMFSIKSSIPCIYHKSVCGSICITIVQEFHVVPCCLHRLLCSPVEAVIRYRQPPGHSYHTQVENRRDAAFPYAAGWEGTGEPRELQTALKVCVTLMSNLSTSARYRGTSKKKKKANAWRKKNEIIWWISLYESPSLSDWGTVYCAPRGFLDGFCVICVF